MALKYLQSKAIFSKVGPNLELFLILLKCTKTSLHTYEIKFVGILVYAPYKKSAIHKPSTAPPIIANVMKQDQDSLGRKLTEYIIQVIKYQLVLFK